MGQEFDVAVTFAGGSALKQVRAQLRYDPAALQLVSADAGDVIPSDIRGTTLPRINQIAGVVQFVANASADAPMQADGSLLVLHFKALTPSATTKISLQWGALAANGMNIPPTQPPPLTIVVTP